MMFGLVNNKSKQMKQLLKLLNNEGNCTVLVHVYVTKRYTEALF